MVTFIVAAAIIAISVLGRAVAVHWEAARPPSYEELIAPVLAKHGLKFVESKTPIFAVYNRPVVIEILGIDLKRLSGESWVARDVVLEDSGGHRIRSHARLNFDLDGLTSIEWNPPLPGVPIEQAETLGEHSFLRVPPYAQVLACTASLLAGGLGMVASVAIFVLVPWPESLFPGLLAGVLSFSACIVAIVGYRLVATRQ